MHQAQQLAGFSGTRDPLLLPPLQAPAQASQGSLHLLLMIVQAKEHSHFTEISVRSVGWLLEFLPSDIAGKESTTHPPPPAFLHWEGRWFRLPGGNFLGSAKRGRGLARRGRASLAGSSLPNPRAWASQCLLQPIAQCLLPSAFRKWFNSQNTYWSPH